MKAVLVSSLDAYSGKTGIIAALALILRERGMKVGYFKPLSMEPAGIIRNENVNESKYEGEGRATEGKSGVVDEDAFRIAKILELPDSPADLCPFVFETPYQDFILSASDVHQVRERICGRIKEAFMRISEGKDIVFVEGVLNYRVGKCIELCDFSIASLLNADILMIAKYTNFVLDDILYAREHARSPFKVLFNQIPNYKLAYVKSLKSFLNSHGISVVGAIPHDALLSGLSVDEICEAVGGKFLVKPREDTVVEQLLVGAMTPQSAVTYFRRSRNAAIITGGDRAELQALAIEIPSIKCILLTGNLEPPTVIKGAAASKNKPIILAPDDTLTVVNRLNRAFGKARLHSMIKINRMKELIQKYVNIDEIIG